ncbi:MAG: hypothetical protein M3518_04630 [Actinomycetota bacterium]|nr:hypothetical protein [Actinomycetota bacterium]
MRRLAAARAAAASWIVQMISASWCGLVSPGLPVGLQIIGWPLDEATGYRYGRTYEETNSPGPGEASR